MIVNGPQKHCKNINPDGLAKISLKHHENQLKFVKKTISLKNIVNNGQIQIIFGEAPPRVIAKVMSATVHKKVFSRWSFCTKSQVLRSQMCPNLCKWQSLNTMMMIVKYDKNGGGDGDEKYPNQHHHYYQ